MAPSLPGVFELRDQDDDFWYRMLYKEIDGVIYVLHCLRKKTTQTPQRDIHTTSLRLKNVRQRIAEQRKREGKNAETKQR